MCPLYGTLILLSITPMGSTKGFNESSWSLLSIDYPQSVPPRRGALRVAAADRHAYQRQCPELGRYNIEDKVIV